MDKNKDRYLSNVDSYLFNRQTDLIGQGSFGEVYMCYHKDRPSEKLAIKIMHQLAFSKSERELLKKMTHQEITTQFSSKHSNTLKLIETKTTTNEIFLITEYCEKNLSTDINNLTVYQAFVYMDQIVRAMIYLNKKKIIHRDLKPANILLRNNEIKIADFGFARFVDDPKRLSEKTFDVGSPLYLAPEIYRRKPYDARCDVWSVGIILYQMIYEGVCPWDGHSVSDLFENNILKKPLTFPEEPVVKDEIKFLIIKMLEIKVDDRFDFKQVRDYMILLDKDLRYYCEYLKMMADFYNDLEEKIQELKTLTKNLRIQLAIVLKKFEIMCFYKMDEVAKNEKGLELFEKQKSAYQKMFKKAKKSFKEDILEKYENRKSKFPANFNKFVFNEEFKISKDYEKEYRRVFNEVLNEIWDNFGELRELDKEKLKVIMKLLEIRSVRKLEKNFAFDDEKFYLNPFKNLIEKMEELKKTDLIDKIVKRKG